MIFKDLISTDTFMSIATSIFGESEQDYKLSLFNILSQFWDKNQFRTVRKNYNNTFSIRLFVENYLSVNKQKIKTMIETINGDIIGTETINEDLSYNVDYGGGEGIRYKQGSKNLFKDNKRKLFNFYNLTDNYLIKQLENLLFETFEESEVVW